MPNFTQGNIFNTAPDVVKVITTNGCITNDNKLVMGRGAALEATQRYTGIARIAADRIKTAPHLQVTVGTVMCNIYNYYIAHIPMFNLMLFQVKYHWKQPANLDLIHASVWAFTQYAESHSDIQFALNYPGIGNGNLAKELVAPYLTLLPNNVTIYEL